MLINAIFIASLMQSGGAADIYAAQHRTARTVTDSKQFAGNAMVMGNYASHYAAANQSITGPVSATALGVPPWYTSYPGLQTYVNQGSAYLFIAPGGLISPLSAFKDIGGPGVIAGIKSGGVIKDGTGRAMPTSVPIPGAIPDGSMVLVTRDVLPATSGPSTVRKTVAPMSLLAAGAAIGPPTGFSSGTSTPITWTPVTPPPPIPPGAPAGNGSCSAGGTGPGCPPQPPAVPTVILACRIMAGADTYISAASMPIVADACFNDGSPAQNTNPFDKRASVAIYAGQSWFTTPQVPVPYPIVANFNDWTLNITAATPANLASDSAAMIQSCSAGGFFQDFYAGGTNGSNLCVVSIPFGVKTSTFTVTFTYKPTGGTSTKTLQVNTPNN